MARSFNDILSDLGGGDTHAQLTDALAELVRQVQDTEKSGYLTLKLTVTPNGDRAVIITDTITAKLPEPKRPQALFFTDGGGGLHRKDPMQPDLPLREVSDIKR